MRWGTSVSEVVETPAVPRPRSRVAPVGVLAVAHSVNDAYAFVLQALLPAIMPPLGLTLGMAGGLVSLFQLTSSLAQPFVGHYADRRGLRWPAWAGVAASGVGAGLIGLAPDYLALVGLVCLSGIGTAVFHPVAGAMVGAAAPERLRGRWMGLFVTAGNVGMAFGPLALGLLLVRGGPSATWPILLPSLVLAALVAIFAPRSTAPRTPIPPLLGILRRHRRVLSALVLVVGLRASIHAAMVTSLPLLGHMRGLSVGEAAQTLTVYLAAVAIGGLLGGFAADRWGRDRVISVSLLLSVPFGLMVALRPEVDAVFFLATAFSGFFLNATFVVLTIRGQESVPGSVGMVTGIVLGFSLGLGGLAMTPLGLLAERIGLPEATALAAALGIVAAISVRLLPPLSDRLPEGVQWAAQIVPAKEREQ